MCDEISPGLQNFGGTIEDWQRVRGKVPVQKPQGLIVMIRIGKHIDDPVEVAKGLSFASGMPERARKPGQIGLHIVKQHSATGENHHRFAALRQLDLDITMGW